MAKYTASGPFTRLRADQVEMLDEVPADPVGIGEVVRGLVIHVSEAGQAGVPAERLGEKDIRPAAAILGAALAVDPAPLVKPREPARRVVGTCRDFVVLGVALMRARGMAARARAGFATYFQPGRSVDHWVAEYRHAGSWLRYDVEHDRWPGAEFQTGGEAWRAYRAGADPATFGVLGTEHAWGVGEIRGNAVRDLAALCDREMLPWDEWGRMTASYDGRTGDDYDLLMDRIAAACGSGDDAAVAAIYASEDLAVPETMVG